MKPVDYAKAAGVAIVLLVFNVLIAVFVVAVYATVVEPGHPSEFYEEAAKRISPWCSHIAGTGLFFVATWFLTFRRPERSVYLFAAVVSVLYAIIDAATVGFSGIWETEFALSMLPKLIAAIAGAFVGSRTAATPVSVLESWDK